MSVVDLRRYRPEIEPQERAINALWDRLTIAADAAWTWRDPDSLYALEVVVAELRRVIEAGWET